MADGSLLFNTKLDATGFQKGMGKLSGLAKTGLGGVGNLAKNVGTKLTNMHKVGGVALAALGGLAIKAGADFDAGMSEVQAISGATAEELEALRTKAKQMGATTKFSATESAEALKYMAMAGWDSQKMLDGLPGVMNLAAASGENLGLVSDIVTDSMTAFGIEASKAGEFADVLAMTSSKSNTNVALLGESFKYVAPLAGALGYSSEDTAVALGLMANAGIKGSQAGTTLKTSLANLAKPSKQMATYMDKLGISMTDSAGEVKPLDQLLREMRGSFADLSEAEQAQAASAIFGKESMAGMLAILNTSEADFDSLTKSINNSTGAAEDMAKVMNDNLKGDITLFKSALEGVGIALYEGVDNPARKVVQAFSGYMGQLQSAIDGPNDKVNEFLERTGMTADEAGTVIEDNRSMIERIGGAFGDILGDMAGKVAAAVPEMIKGAEALIGALFQGLSENTGAIAEAGTAIMSGLLEIFLEYGGQFLEFGINVVTEMAQGLSQKAPKLVQEALSALTRVTDALWENMPLLLEAGGQMLVSLAEGLVTAIPQIAVAILDMVQFMLFTLIDIAPDLIKAGFDMIANLAQGIAEYIPELMVTITELIPTILTALIEGLPQLFEAGITILSSLVTGILEALPLLIEAIPQLITTIIDYISEALPMLLESGLGIMVALINGLVENLPLLVDATLQIIDAIVGFITDNLPLLIESAIEILMTLANGIVEALPLLIESAGEILNSLITTITENLPLLIEMALEMIISIVTGIIDNLDKIIEAAVALIDTIIMAVLDNLPAIINATIEIVLAVANAIIDNLDKLIPPMIELILTLTEAIIERLDLIIDAALQIIEAVVKGLLDNLPKIIDATIRLIVAITTEIITRLPEIVAMGLRIVTELIGGIIGAIPDLIAAAFELILGFLGEITKNLPDILAAGAGLVGSLISGILGVIGDIVGAAGDIAGAAVGAVKEGFSGAMNIGKDLVSGLWNGINDKKDWVVDKVKGIGGSIMSGLKGFFGIKSPSRLMRDEIGKMIPPGIGVGIEAAAPAMLRTADAEMDKLQDKLTAGITLDSTIQAKASKDAIKTVSEFDYIIADDGKKMIMAGDIHSTIQIDGRPVAKAITPYVSEEQSLNKKRRA